MTFLCLLWSSPELGKLSQFLIDLWRQFKTRLPPREDLGQIRGGKDAFVRVVWGNYSRMLGIYIEALLGRISRVYSPVNKQSGRHMRTKARARNVVPRTMP